MGGGAWVAYGLLARAGGSGVRGGLVEAALADAAAFRPDRALARLREVPSASYGPDASRGLKAIQEELSHMEAARQNLIRDLNDQRLRLTSLRLRDGTALPEPQVIDASAAGIGLSGAGGVRVASWQEIEPAQVLELAQRCGLIGSEADRLGFALYARRAGLAREARAMLESLEGTRFEGIARRYRD